MVRTVMAAVLLLVAQGATAGVSEALAAYESEDFATALREFRALASEGNPEGQYHLGLMYDKGEGVEEDDDEAVKWYELAANQGQVEAQQTLGYKYARGEGLAQDDVAAFAWSNIAANSGNELAIKNRDYLMARLDEDERVAAQNLSDELAAKVSAPEASSSSTQLASTQAAPASSSAAVTPPPKTDEATAPASDASASTEAPSSGAGASGETSAAASTAPASDVPAASPAASSELTTSQADAPSRPKMDEKTLVRELQTALKARGYKPGPSDGVMGRRTRRAIRAAQRDEGLPVTGRPSEELLDRLKAE